MFFDKEMPTEVKEYLAILQVTGGMMGQDLYNRCQEIIDNNPTWFPWEIKYKSIPKEVHEAYNNEMYSDEKLFWNAFKEDTQKIKQFDGLFSLVMQQQRKADSPKSAKEIIEAFIEKEAQDRKSKDDEAKRNKEIWDKHYKKYGLEFRC